MVNGNCLHVSFFPDPALPETFSLIALATCCWSQCHFPSMKQSVSISPAWQVFLCRSYPASVSTCWHLDIWVTLICRESGGKPLCVTLCKQGPMPNIISHHTRAPWEARPSTIKRARVQKCSLLLVGIKWKSLQVSSLPGSMQKSAGWVISWGGRKHMHKSSGYVIQPRAGAWFSHI